LEVFHLMADQIDPVKFIFSQRRKMRTPDLYCCTLKVFRGVPTFDAHQAGNQVLPLGAHLQDVDIVRRRLVQPPSLRAEQRTGFGGVRSDAYPSRDTERTGYMRYQNQIIGI
jgi:hypothetical protein